MSCLLAQNSQAEGAVRELSCEYERVCDAAGNCQDEDGTMIFTMEPQTVADDGAGSFVIHYGDSQAPMQAAGYAGPFSWTLPGEQHTLLASNETRFLWHQVTLAPQPQATIRFMRCRLTQ